MELESPGHLHGPWGGGQESWLLLADSHSCLVGLEHTMGLVRCSGPNGLLCREQWQGVASQ